MRNQTGLTDDAYHRSRALTSTRITPGRIQRAADKILWESPYTGKTTKWVRHPQYPVHNAECASRTMGIGLLHWTTHVRALQTKWILNYLNARKAIWKHALDAWFCRTGLRTRPRGRSILNPYKDAHLQHQGKPGTADILEGRLGELQDPGNTSHETHEGRSAVTANMAQPPRSTTAQARGVDQPMGIPPNTCCT